MIGPTHGVHLETTIDRRFTNVDICLKCDVGLDASTGDNRISVVLLRGIQTGNRPVRGFRIHGGRLVPIMVESLYFRLQLCRGISISRRRSSYALLIGYT